MTRAGKYSCSGLLLEVGLFVSSVSESSLGSCEFLAKAKVAGVPALLGGIEIVTLGLDGPATGSSSPIIGGGWKSGCWGSVICQ